MKQEWVWKLAVAAGLISGNAMGQPAVPAAPVVPEPPKWESSAGLGLTLTRGNSDTVLFTANAQTKKKMPHDEYAFGVDGTYGKANSVKNNDSLHGFGQYNHLFNDRFYGYLRADGLHDDIADVEYRFTIGPGAGYYFVKEKMTTLSAEVGPAFVFEKQGSKSKSYLTLRVAERFEHKFNDKARMWQSLEFLPQVDDFANYIVNSEIGVEADITAKVSLQTYLQDTYDNRPAAGRKANDLKLVSGIKYKF